MATFHFVPVVRSAFPINPWLARLACVALRKVVPKLDPSQTNRSAKLRGWSSESMVEAMKAVKEGQFGVNRAALEYGVPKTTLKDRLNGRVIHGSNMGPTPYLTYEEEKELVRFILNCSRMGYGKTRGELLRIVGETMKKKGRLLVGSLSRPVPVDQSTLSLSKSVSSSLHESPPLQSSSSV